jgi:hypothetical protein
VKQQEEMLAKNTTVFVILFVIGVLLILALFLTDKIARRQIVLFYEGFEDKKPRSQQMDELNGSWRAILQYLSENPDKGGLFVADIKEKFFENSCEFKQPSIDYAKLPDMYRPVFT